jgi:hypothetical protein
MLRRCLRPPPLVGGQEVRGSYVCLIDNTLKLIRAKVLHGNLRLADLEHKQETPHTTATNMYQAVPHSQYVPFFQSGSENGEDASDTFPRRKLHQRHAVLHAAT